MTAKLLLEMLVSAKSEVASLSLASFKMPLFGSLRDEEAAECDFPGGQLLLNALSDSMCHLVVLDLTGAGLTATDCSLVCASVGRSKSLRVLRLSACPIGERGAAYLATSVAGGDENSFAVLDLEQLWLEECGLQAESIGAVIAAFVLRSGRFPHFREIWV